MTARYESSCNTPQIEGFWWREPEDESDKKAFSDILEAGCHLLQILPDSAAPDVPEYVYSVGFYLNLLHPEIMVMGLPSGVSGRMINDLFQHVADGNPIWDREYVTYDIEEERIRFAVREITESSYHDYLGYANWFYRSLRTEVASAIEYNYPALQLVWPDSEGKYPWEPGCDLAVVVAQTLAPQP
ncbi:DUF4262 domain-containing protein [Luteolibacter sp.]